MTNNGRGCFAIVLFGGAKINQDRFIPFCRYDNVRRFDVTMHNGRVLTMQVDESIDNGSQNGQDHRECKTLFWLLFPQVCQASSLYVIHKHIHPLELFDLEHSVDMRQGSVIKSLEELPFKEEALPVELVLTFQLFECKQVAFDAPISHG